VAFQGLPNATTTGQTLATQARLLISVNGVDLGQLALYDDYDVQFETQVKKTVPQNTGGLPVRRIVHEGGTITINATRQNRNIETLAHALMKNYYNGGVDPNVAITEEIAENDNTLTTYAYTGCVIDPKHMGNRRSNDTISGQQLTIHFSLCEEVNGTPNPYLPIVSQPSLT
jgi:hypothetical protein